MRALLVLVLATFATSASAQDWLPSSTSGIRRALTGYPVNVKALGATGDGTTNDTAALQAALDSGTGTVYVPPGTYLFSGITIPDGVILQCASVNSTTLRYTGTGTAIIRTSPPASINWADYSWMTNGALSRLFVYDCTIEKAGATGGVAISLAATVHARVERNRIKNFATGILFDGTAGVFWDSAIDNHIQPCGTTGTGISFIGASNHNTANDNRIYECNRGIVAAGGTNNLFLRNNVEFITGASPVGIFLASAGNTAIENWVETSSITGWSGQGVGIYVQYPGNVLIGNRINGGDNAQFVNVFYASTTGGTKSVTIATAHASDMSTIIPALYAYADLGTAPRAGSLVYCTDCTTAATCAASGTGHLAVSNGTAWTCQ